VVPPQVKQPFIRRLPHPEVERHGAAPEEVVHPSHHFQLGFLHDIGRVHAAGQPGVEADFDEGAQVWAVTRQQCLQGLPVAAADPLEQAGRLG
jgi:hypothetical protein